MDVKEGERGQLVWDTYKSWKLYWYLDSQIAGQRKLYIVII